MSFLLTILGIALGVTLVLVGNPVQMVPRFLRPVRYASAKRVYYRIRADYRIKRCFWLLSGAAACVLIALFLVSMMAPVPEELLPLRILVGLVVGMALAWWLLRRQEVLISRFGVVGLYPDPRLIVSWAGLSGYLVDDQWSAVLLLDRQGEPVEALPYAGLGELQDLELALRPHLRRHSEDLTQGRLPSRTRLLLRLGFLSLLLAVAPIGGCWLLWVHGQTAADYSLLMAILVALFIPLTLLNWSLRFRQVYYGGKGHVQVVHLTSLCQRCHYQAVCWHAGLHRQIRWQPGVGAVVPAYEEFCKHYRQEPTLTAEVYRACCQCLLAHLQEQDIYQVDLRPLGEEQKASS